MKKPKPGTFRTLRKDEKPLKSRRAVTQAQQLEVTDHLVELYRSFAAEYSMPRHVLYPGCGYDISASKVFPHVVYVDQNHYVTDLLRRNGFEAYCKYIQEFMPEISVPCVDFDLLLLLRFPVFPDNLRRLLRHGHLICDYYQAGIANDNPDFEFVKDLESPGKPFRKDAKGYFLFKRR